MSGGWKPKPKLYQVAFGKGTEWEGFEVTLRGMSMGTFFDIAAIGDVKNDTSPDDIRKVIDLIGRRLESWNWAGDDGKPVPCDKEHLLQLDVELVLEVFNQWAKALTGTKDGDEADPTRPSPQPPGLAEASVPTVAGS